MKFQWIHSCKIGKVGILLHKVPVLFKDYWIKRKLIYFIKHFKNEEHIICISAKINDEAWGSHSNDNVTAGFDIVYSGSRLPLFQRNVGLHFQSQRVGSWCKETSQINPACCLAVHFISLLSDPESGGVHSSKMSVTSILLQSSTYQKTVQYKYLPPNGFSFSM